MADIPFAVQVLEIAFSKRELVSFHQVLRGFEMKQAQFAAKIGITQSYPSALERGLKEPGASVLVAISREFGRSVDWPLTGKSPTEPTTYSIVAALSDAGNTIATPITVTPSAPGLLNNETRFFEFVRGF